MTKLSQKYCLVTLLENKSLGYEFDMGEWPIHITFIGVHDVDWNNQKLVEKLDELVKNTRSFKAKTKNIGNMGPQQNPTKVVFIDMNDELLNLHYKLIELLEDFNAKYNNPEWNLEGYVAHSTVQRHGSIGENEEITIDNITLIDMFPNGDGKRRKIFKIFNLK